MKKGIVVQFLGKGRSIGISAGLVLAQVYPSGVLNYVVAHIYLSLLSQSEPESPLNLFLCQT